LEGSSRATIKVLSRHFPGGTEYNHENPLPGWQVSRPRFEPNTSRIQVQGVTASPTHSVKAMGNVQITILVTNLYENFNRFEGSIGVTIKPEAQEHVYDTKILFVYILNTRRIAVTHIAYFLISITVYHFRTPKDLLIVSIHL
jgi:hypothetical protein